MDCPKIDKKVEFILFLSLLFNNNFLSDKRESSFSLLSTWHFLCLESDKT
ncbi:hypothetical protein LptCag_0735 [Leptospirillum ferriphilum]|uniref:Uncharacterized protein n=1 Tax=Leptospirillum ferriphilum TaxID=178606 RepID=A0A094X6D7_9BACT|nr:hypothetical protein LptCag_0735 [Leptospirillum ferriphilum]